MSNDRGKVSSRSAKKNAQWMSEDENFFVASDDGGNTYGYAIVNGEKMPFSADFTSM